MRTRNTPFWGIAILAAVALVALSCPRHRPLRIIFNQNAYGSVANYSELEYSDFFGGVSQIADDFTLATGQSTITSVRWWGAYRNNVPALDHFTIYIYEVFESGEPNSMPWYEFTSSEAERTLTGDSFMWGMSEVGIYEYNLEIDDCPLGAGQPYLISIVNDTGRWGWLVNGASAQGNNIGYGRDEEWGDWSMNAIDSAFVLWSDK